MRRGSCQHVPHWAMSRRCFHVSYADAGDPRAHTRATTRPDTAGSPLRPPEGVSTSVLSYATLSPGQRGGPGD
jgi:hypothetical protein